MEKYLKQKEVLFLLLAPFFKPLSLQYYSKLSVIENCWIAWKIAAAMVGMCFLLYYMWNNKKIIKFIVGIGVFEAGILFSTLIHKGNIVRSMIDTVSIVAFVSILFLGIHLNARGLFQVLYRYLIVLMVFNLLTMVIFPKGLSADLYVNSKVNTLYFMTIDNGNALFLSFCILVMVVYGYMENNVFSIRNIVITLAIILSALLSGSATAVLIICVEVILILIAARTSWIRKIKPKTVFLIYILFIPFLFSLQNNFVVGFILENVFNRSADISGRSLLWEFAIEKIMKQPILGYGRQTVNYIETWGGYFSSHNFFLEMMLQGGIVALAGFGFIFNKAINKISELRYNKLTMNMMIVLLMVLVAALVEAEVHSIYIFGCITFCYFCKNLEESV